MWNSQPTLVLLGKRDYALIMSILSLKSWGASAEVTTEQSCLFCSNVLKWFVKWLPSR